MQSEDISITNASVIHAQSDVINQHCFDRRRATRTLRLQAILI
uniref:Uncharacterized protein n=1 Tax=Anguilla anguilla TaxID=7936 RepID=A0A0E9UPM7_ANGAN